MDAVPMPQRHGTTPPLRGTPPQSNANNLTETWDKTM